MSIKTHTFKNGLKYIHQSGGHSLPISTIFLFIRFGSIHEKESNQKGIAHFIEHMCFKGTREHPTSISIITTYDEIGAFINAETSKQFTCYKIKCMNQWIEPCISVLSDILFHSIFRKNEMKLEQHVVKEENIRNNDNPTSHIDDMIYKSLYDETPYSYPVDSIEYPPQQPKDVVEIYRRFYQQQHMGISVVSNMSFDHIGNILAKTSFVSKNQQIHLSDSIDPPPKMYDSPQYSILKKKGIQATHIGIAFKTCPHSHKDKYPLLLLKNILGGYMTSRLFMILREKNGLTYTSSCQSIHHSSSGHFEIYTLCDPTKVLKNGNKPGVLPILSTILQDLISKGITHKELEVAKGNFQGNHILHLEEGDHKCEYNGIEYILYDNREMVPYERLYDVCLKSVTKGQVNEVARKYFQPAFMTVCLVGENVPVLQSVRQVFSK